MKKFWPSIDTIAQRVQNQESSAVEQVKKAYTKVDEVDDTYKVLVARLDELALKRAEEIDIRIKNGENVGCLAGVPFIAKDNYLVFGADSTASSNILKGFSSPYQSTAVERLEAEGAICIAKANLDAFAHGSSTENSDFFTTKNPHDEKKVPGGSSGGSAAAVALDMAPFALGSDTGGSIRLPASYCGVVGYKPTYGLVSRSGVVAMGSSTDVMGPLSRSTADAALVLDVMAGKDELDGTTIEREDSYLGSTSLKGKKIGVIKEYMGDGIDASVAETINTAIQTLKDAGAEVNEISLPSMPLALAVYYIIVPAELSSNLSRHDGQRYQFSASDVKDLEESYMKTRSEGFGAEAKRRIMIGTHVLSSGYYDAYYKKAQTVRTKLINEFAAAFENCDALIGPVAPTTAFEIGALSDDPLQMYLQDIMTVSSSLAGLPAISVPAGEDADGMPIGLQIIGPQRGDSEVLGLAKAYEEVRS